jgi:sporulation protein YlmC with PRC-barrel domain
VVSSLINLEILIGKKVIGTGGYIIGELKGVTIDEKTWKVALLHVKLTDNTSEELGFKKRFRSSTVNMPIKMVQAVGDVITLSPSLKELSKSRKITEFKQ